MYKKFLEDNELYQKAQKNYRRLQNKKQLLFDKTQPGAVKYDGEKVSGGTHKNSWDTYIEKAQELEDQIYVAEGIVKARRLILKLSEQDLRESRNTADMIFVARFLERKKVYQITGIVNYSERTVKTFLKDIRNELKKYKDCTFLHF
jgi:hypothetical protein